MNIETLRSELQTQIKRLTVAYNALSDTAETIISEASEQLADEPQATSTSTGHRTVSTLTRKRISRSMKKNWESGRRSNKRKMSPEVRSKISDAQKARWAKQKVASATVAASAPTATQAAA